MDSITMVFITPFYFPEGSIYRKKLTLLLLKTTRILPRFLIKC